MNTPISPIQSTKGRLCGPALPVLVAASLWLFAGIAGATDAPAGPPAPAKSAKKEKSAARKAPGIVTEIPIRTAEDDQSRDNERAIQLAARAKGLVAEAKKDLAAKRYDEALKKADYVLGIAPKNAEAARIKKQAEAALK